MQTHIYIVDIKGKDVGWRRRFISLPTLCTVLKAIEFEYGRFDEKKIGLDVNIDDYVIEEIDSEVSALGVIGEIAIKCERQFPKKLDDTPVRVEAVVARVSVGSITFTREPAYL